MNEIFKKLKGDLLEQLSDLDEKLPPLERLSATNHIAAKAINTIKETLKEQEFDSEEDEIQFYKFINPEILSHPIEEGIRYNILINEPIHTVENIVKYYEDELKVMQSFFRMNNFHYQYFKNNFVELDKIYFTNYTGPLTIPLPEVPYHIGYRCTPMSCLFAQFIANERIQHFILQQIAKTRHWVPGFAENFQSDGFPEIKWTGDITNVVELAYGIHLTGQINNGNASLNQIVRWLERSLKINIGNIQKKFTEIEGRKRLSFTRFLDRMKQEILRKIDSDNS
ncbi:RteC domain-containing protein [Mucilaginibacter sp. cycad4]|uniref:RteC domain-containing protein n=1 Tax=Mucilaginibacter sp. cycad4 TaxID=3342096 RepID=UPI002AAB3C9F|nr:RteC domain-containing protein [Mucilaginibacter gossypii]WPU99087.1 RteC domain-containing protein [Mucilaginibacter gossypii]